MSGRVVVRPAVDAVCRSIVERVEGAVACGVVDIQTGELLGVHDDGVDSEAMRSAIRASAIDLSRGATGVGRGVSPALTDGHVTSDSSDHFAKAVAGGRALLLLVTRRATNIGMGWAQVNAAIPKLEQELGWEGARGATASKAHGDGVG